MRHIISILMENESGALSRVSGLFSARGYNIESLTVAPTDDPTMSRMTLVTRGDDATIEQIVKQLNKLVDVIKLMDLNDQPFIEREMLLIKLAADNLDVCSAIKRLADIFRGRIIDVRNRTYTIEVTGSSDKVDAFIDAVNQFQVIEVVRSGSMGIGRGHSALKL